MFWETLDEELIDDLLDKFTGIKKEEVLGGGMSELPIYE
jgi:hypothetical protein